MKLTTFVPAVLTLCATTVFAQAPATTTAGADAQKDTPAATATQNQTNRATTAAPAAGERNSTAAQGESNRSSTAAANAGGQSTAGAAHSASSSAMSFTSADADKDGLLSISEAQKVLPDLGLADKNADGFVNQSEVEEAIDGLKFSEHGHTGGSALVSEGEFDLLVSQMQNKEGRNSSTSQR